MRKDISTTNFGSDEDTASITKWWKIIGGGHKEPKCQKSDQIWATRDSHSSRKEDLMFRHLITYFYPWWIKGGKLSNPLYQDKQIGCGGWSKNRSGDAGNLMGGKNWLTILDCQQFHYPRHSYRLGPSRKKLNSHQQGDQR